jgi:hypothetical protein
MFHLPISEIGKVARSFTYLFVVYILFLWATVILTLLVWSSGNKFQAAIKRDADGKIEAAKAVSEIARAEAAKANEQTASLVAQTEEARLKQREIEQQNLVLRADLNKATEEAARLQIRAAEAEKALLDFIERLAPRHLSDKQGIHLATILTGQTKGNITVSCVGSDREAFAFAQEIYALLKDVGWEVQGINTVAMTIGQPSGLSIAVKSNNSPSARLAGLLQRAFEQIGFKMAGQLESRLSEYEVELLVGSKS